MTTVKPFRAVIDMSPVGWGKLGLGTYARGLAQGLQRLHDQDGEALSIELLYLAPERPVPPAAGSIFRNRVVRLPHGWLLRLWHGLNRFPVDRWTGADVVHGSAFTVPFTRGPAFTTVHDLSWEAMPELFSPKALAFNRRWHRLCAEHCLRTGGSLIVPSRFVATEVERSWGVPKERIVVTPEAVDPVVFHTPTDGEIRSALDAFGLVHERYVLCLGLVETRKNLIGAIAAWETYRSQGGQAALVVVGKDGRGSVEIHERAARSPWAEQIRFLGHVPQDRMAGLIGGCLAGFYLSFYEGFGLPVLEFFACGATSLASRRSSVPEVWGDGPSPLPALLFEPDDAQTAGEELLALETQPDRLRTYRDYAVRRNGDFSWKDCARSTLEAWKGSMRA